MPHSADEGKDWTRERVVALNPGSVLDIGPGAGTYAKLLRPHLPGTEMWGIEVFEPYVERYGLNDLYDRVLVTDARTAPFPTVDVVILGDVLEHMQLTEAVEVWHRALRAARMAVFASLPIIDYPQGALEGNCHETHLVTWDHDMVMATLPGIEEFATYTIVGVYRGSVACLGR